MKLSGDIRVGGLPAPPLARAKVEGPPSAGEALPGETFVPSQAPMVDSLPLVEAHKTSEAPGVAASVASQEKKTSVAHSHAPLLMEVEAPPLSAGGVRELVSWGDTLKTVDQHKGTFLILGFGSKGQYKDPEAAQQALSQLADQLDAEYGKSRWLAVFGGDNYKADAPDVAAMVKFLQDERGVPAMALQSDKVKDWGGVDQHLDYVHYVPTTTTPGPDGKEKIVWGGFLDGKPAGPTAAYLGEDFIGGKNPRLKGVIAIGGGEIAGQEALYAKGNGIPVHYIRAEAKFEVPGGKYGAIDGMLV